MEIDPNIILRGARPMQQFDPMGAMQQGMTMRALMEQSAHQRQIQQMDLADRQRGQQQMEAARQVWQDAQGDEAKVLQGLGSAGLFEQHQAAAKAFDDRRKSQAAASKDEGDAKLKGQSFLRQFATRLSPDAPDDATAALVAGAVQRGEISREQAESIGDMLTVTPRQQWGRAMMQMIASPEDWLKLQTPDIKAVNDGQMTHFVDQNAMTNPNQAPLQMQATPGEVLTDARGQASNRISAGQLAVAQGNAAETRRHNRAGETNAAGQLTVAQRNAAAREAEVGAGGKPPQGYIWGPGGGSLVPIPGGPGDPKMRGLNENQSNAGTFGGRMAAAGDVLNAVGQDGKVQPSLVKRVADSVPVIGGALGMAANSVFASPQQQQIEQAERDFINATLRRESGAAIGPGEFANARQQYFPQPGDSKEVVAQKLANRQRATQSMLQVVPEAFRQDYTAGTTLAEPQQPAPTAQPAQRPPQPAQQQPAQQFKALPMPQQYAGKRIRDDRTGQILRSDGKNWVPEGR